MYGWSAAEESAVTMQIQMLAIKADVRSGQMSGWSVRVNVPLDQNRPGSRRVTVRLWESLPGRLCLGISTAGRIGFGSKKVTRVQPSMG